MSLTPDKLSAVLAEPSLLSSRADDLQHAWTAACSEGHGRISGLVCGTAGREARRIRRLPCRSGSVRARPRPSSSEAAANSGRPLARGAGALLDLPGITSQVRPLSYNTGPPAPFRGRRASPACQTSS